MGKIEITDDQAKVFAKLSPDFKKELEKKRPEFFIEPFKDKDFAINIHNNIYIVGYHYFERCNDEHCTPKWYNDGWGFVHPTKEQIQAYLTAEFWKLFKVGDKIKSVRSYRTVVLQGNEVFQIWFNSLAINLGNDGMIAIFDIDNIKWATKVEEKEKEYMLWQTASSCGSDYIISKEKPLTNEEIIKLRKLIK